MAAQQKILVIDDSRVIRRMVKDMLPEGNFEVLEAGDGVEGFNLLRQEMPNLIMLDFLLPKMSGWQVYQEIQKHPRLQKIPLVLMSGRKEEVTEKLSEPFEYFAFVGKPFEKKHLINAIKEAMTKARKRPTPAAHPSSNGSSPASAEIEALNQKVAKMQTEIDGLKKQLTQLVSFIKQKLK